MEGLAQSAVQQNPMRDLDQVVQMLIEGVSPEELIQMGVPEELVMAAIDVIGKQANTIPQSQEGLAGMHLPQQGR